MQHGTTPGMYLGTVTTLHLHGGCDSPPGPPPAASSAVAAAPAVLFYLSSSWSSHSWPPVFPSAAPSVGSAVRPAAVTCPAPPRETFITPYTTTLLHNRHILNDQKWVGVMSNS